MNLTRTLSVFSAQVISTLLFIIWFHNGATLPIKTDPQAMMYLSQFGYLSAKLRNPGSGMIITEDAMKTAVSEFQSFAGINVTGDLDEETKKLMSLPRCGVKDVVGSGSNARRRRRYALQGSRWRVKALTYRISSYPKTTLKQADVDKELANAFKVWSDHTDLTFTAKKSGQAQTQIDQSYRRPKNNNNRRRKGRSPKSDSVHIDIRFARGEHGDGDPFDGPGGTLAHAYFPVYGGDAHFDDSETWTIRSYRGTNLFQVAAHEFGHSLGLSHSDVRASLMAPFYRGYDSSFKLHEDDIQAIQSLYGTGSNRKPPQKQPHSGNLPEVPGDRGGGGGNGINPMDDPVLCASNIKIDAIFTEGGSTYVFKGDKHWRLTDEGVAPGYPRTIASTWPGLPDDIDAAFTYSKNSKTYFFKGGQYWRFSGKKMDSEYPKRISDGFQGIPSNVDAAMVWGGNGKIYFFKGSLFYRFDPTSKPPVKSTYPKSLSNWAGIPDDLDAALQYTNGYTYFFKQGQYYRFNDRTFAVDTAEPSFPRPTGFWWFGCQAGTRGSNQRQPDLYPLNRPSFGPDEGDLTLDTDLYQEAKQTLDTPRNKENGFISDQAPPAASPSTQSGNSALGRISIASSLLIICLAILRFTP